MDAAWILPCWSSIACSSILQSERSSPSGPSGPPWISSRSSTCRSGCLCMAAALRNRSKLRVWVVQAIPRHEKIARPGKAEHLPVAQRVRKGSNVMPCCKRRRNNSARKHARFRFSQAISNQWGRSRRKPSPPLQQLLVVQASKAAPILFARSADSEVRTTSSGEIPAVVLARRNIFRRNLRPMEGSVNMRHRKRQLQPRNHRREILRPM